MYHSFIFNSLYPTQMAPMTTTVGKLEPPFGKTRLQVLKMFSAILQTNSDDVNEEFAKLGTLQAMWVSIMGAVNKPSTSCVRTACPKLSNKFTTTHYNLYQASFSPRYILWVCLNEYLTTLIQTVATRLSQSSQH